MTEPHIRIFPHSKEEFVSRDTFTTWLWTALKAAGGQYSLRRKDAVADLPPGSLVLFRYGSVVVGEAVVVRYSSSPSRGQALSGKPQKYEACVWFSPSSIRIYAPPVEINVLQAFIVEEKDLTYPRSYAIIKDWTPAYPKLLGHVAQFGAFV